MRSMSSASRPSGARPCGLPGLPHRVPHRQRILRMAEDLVAELAGVAGAAHHDRHAIAIADAADGEVEPGEFRRGSAAPAASRRSASGSRGSSGPGRRCCAAGRSRTCTQTLRPRFSASSRSQLAVILVAADPAEVVAAQAEHGAVVEHAAMLVAHGGVDHLPHRQLADVARAGELHAASRHPARAPRTCAAATGPSPPPSRGRPSTRRRRRGC